MWPGLVGKGDGPDQEPPISLERMLELTAGAEVNGQKFDGIDYFLFLPHTDPSASDEDLRKIADMIAGKGFDVGSLVAPVWPGTIGDSAMGTAEQRGKFLEAVKMGCRVAKVFNEHGVRKYGVIRIDSAEFGIEKWRENPQANTATIVETFKEAAKIAADHGERLAAEGEICWGGMHSWRENVKLLEMIDMPGVVGYQADMAHSMLFTLGYNAEQDRLLPEGYDWKDRSLLDKAYKQVADALRPWTLDFHVAQNDGSVHGTGSHDKTGRHCRANDPNGKLDIAKCSSYWLKDAAARGMKHICWDGCMFDNSVLEDPATWNAILKAMVAVDEAL